MSNINVTSSTALRVISYALILIGTVWLGSVIFLFDKSMTPTTTFVGMIASFLGLDVAKVLKATYDAPKNKFKIMRKFRYMFCLLMLLALYVLCVVLKDKKDIVDTAGMLTNGAFVIMGLFSACLGGNKILTNHHGKDGAIKSSK